MEQKTTTVTKTKNLDQGESVVSLNNFAKIRMSTECRGKKVKLHLQPIKSVP